MTDLVTLALKHGTDKQNGHSYAQHYQRHFEPFRDRPITLLEIGIGGYGDPRAGGESLRLWKEYFPRAQIVGLDIHEKSGLREDRIHTVMGSQDDPNVIRDLVAEFGGFDLVIDDGSHVSAQVIRSFELLFPELRSGGLYVVEDLQTSYWPGLGGSSADLRRDGTSINYFKALVDNLNYNEIIRPGYVPSYLDENVFALSFYHNLLFVEKADNREPSNHLVAGTVPDWLRPHLLGDGAEPA